VAADTGSTVVILLHLLYFRGKNRCIGRLADAKYVVLWRVQVRKTTAVLRALVRARVDADVDQQPLVARERIVGLPFSWLRGFPQISEADI
jgi:hypothetical protein